MKQFVLELLRAAGIEAGGPNPWDIRIHNEAFYRRVLREGSLGLGESYMEGWWDCDRLDEFIFRLLRSGIEKKVRVGPVLALKLSALKLFNLQSKSRAFIIGEKHYDLGNDLFGAMLDKRMNYSCGYWNGASTLDEAQENKLELICRKLELKPGMRVLDIGCGWGAFGAYAAEKFQVKVVGLTVSGEQIELGRKMCAGLPVEFRLMDYRDLSGVFDRIVSVGMIEHVGYKNYRTFFEVAARCLKDDGLFLLHTLGSNYSARIGDPWMHKYIFPNGMLPSIAQLGRAAENIFVMEDWHNFGADYDKTLMAWYHNFEQASGALMKNYPAEFYRMWKYYLLSCAGSCRARKMQLWQVVLSRHGLLLGYHPER